MHDRTRQLRDLMERHRQTPRDIGRLIGVSNRTVSNWKLENGPVIPQCRLDQIQFRLMNPITQEAAHG